MILPTCGTLTSDSDGILSVGIGQIPRQRRRFGRVIWGEVGHGVVDMAMRRPGDRGVKCRFRCAKAWQWCFLRITSVQSLPIVKHNYQHFRDDKLPGFAVFSSRSYQANRPFSRRMSPLGRMRATKQSFSADPAEELDLGTPTTYYELLALEARLLRKKWE